MSTKTKFKLIFGIAVTVLIFYCTFKTLGGLNVNALLDLKINWLFAAVSVALNLFANYIRSLCYTLGIDPNIDRLTAFQIVGIGHAVNMVLPLHIGDGLRLAFFPSGYSTLRRTKLVVIPGVADFVAIIMISLFAVPFSGFKDHRLVKALWVLTFLCIALVVLLISVIFCMPRLRSYIGEYLNMGLLKMMFWVTLSWIFLLFSTWFGLAAYGFRLAASLRMSLAVFAATNIISLVPSSPGALGLFEYGAIVGLAGLGIGQNAALPAGVLLHLTQYVALLPLGLFLFITALRGKYGETLKKKLRLKP